MASQAASSGGQRYLILLSAVLFLAYLCVGISLPVVPVFVARDLGLSNAFAGLGVGIAFVATLFSRSYAGALADRRGAKMAVSRGLAFYIVGAVLSLIAGLETLPTWPAYSVLAAGRVVTGIGESLVLMGSAAWGIGLVGPARSGTVLSLVGAAVYGATAAGAPLGVWLLDRIGFSGVMAVSTVLPALGFVALARLPGVALNANAPRHSFRSVLGRVLPHSLVICLHGIGFAAISAFFSLHFLAEKWPHAGLGLTAFGVGFVLVRILCGGLPDRIGGLLVALGSLALEFLGQVLIWLAQDPVLALTGAFFTGLGCSMLFPAMGREVVHRVDPQMRATALGAFAAFQDIAFGLTGPAAGYLADRAGYNSVFLVGAIAAALAFAIVLALRQRP